MTDQAIYLGRITEIEGLIPPPISDVAACTPRPIRREGDAVIVDRIDLPPVNLSSALNILLQGPGPVGRFHDPGLHLIMAPKALAGNLRPTLERPFQLGMLRDNLLSTQGRADNQPCRQSQKESKYHDTTLTRSFEMTNSNS
jgi:hypothetical protein